ncbi:MAG: ABC transporter permease [Acidobacteria bacterium]|nr:ABC transporter permease [Acidobacteriota bacterium]
MFSRLRSFLTAWTQQERFEDGLGSVESTKDDCRHARGLRVADELRQDIRYALRGLWRSPLFAWIAFSSLALGIGANTAIFSFVDAILLQRLPVAEPDRLVTFTQTHRGEGADVVWPLRTIDALAEETPAFKGFFGWFSRPINLSAGDDGRWVNGELVTGQYYRTLGVAPAIGRLLNDEDVRNAIADPVCVLSHGLWQRAFGGDPGVVGRTVLLNGHGYRVVGVTARGFHGAELHRRFDVAAPATRIGDFMPALGGAPGAERMNTVSWLAPMGRLGDGVGRAEAERMARLALQEIDPDRRGQLWLEDGAQGFNTVRPEFGRPVLILMGVAGLVLLVACANLANLLLARAQARSGELGVRLSLGASSGRLARQLLVETGVLAIIGGLGGFALSFWIGDTLMGILNAGRSAISTMHVTADDNVLAFSALLTCATAILCGVAPAWQATRPELFALLKREPAASGSRSRLTMGIDVPGYLPTPVRRDAVVSFNFVSSEYFETLGQSVIRGRDFDERDSRERPPVAIVNETFVEHFFDGRNPIGRRLRQGGEELEIVGVVADSRDQAIRSGPADTVYIHEKHGPQSAMTLLVRAGDEPEGVVPSLLAIIGNIDRRMPVASVHALDVDVEAGISSERMLGYLSTLFAGLTLLLAGIGLYGVLASAVVRRTREIGLRLALGARRSSVVLLVSREAAALLIAGAAVGGFLAFAGGQALQGVLFGVTSTDPLTMAGSILVLTVVGILSTATPLRRALRVDPMVTLRSE